MKEDYLKIIFELGGSHPLYMLPLPAQRFAVGQGAVEECYIHQVTAVIVPAAKELARGHYLHAQLFAALAHERRGGVFAAAHLSAREFPQPRKVLALRVAADEYAASAAYYRRNDF